LRSVVVTNPWNQVVNEGNLGAKEPRKRLVMGVTALVLGSSMAFTFRPLSVVGYVSICVLFWIAGLGIFQAKEKT